MQDNQSQMCGSCGQNPCACGPSGSCGPECGPAESGCCGDGACGGGACGGGNCDSKGDSKRSCKCMHHSAFSILLLLFGLLFLFQAFGWLSAGFVSFGWPVLVILAAIVKGAGKKCKCCK